MIPKAYVEITSFDLTWLDSVVVLLLGCFLILIYHQTPSYLLGLVFLISLLAIVSYMFYRAFIKKLERVYFSASSCHMVIHNQLFDIGAVTLHFLSPFCLVFTIHLNGHIRLAGLTIQHVPICLFSCVVGKQVLNQNGEFHWVFIAFKTGYLRKLLNIAESD